MIALLMSMLAVIDVSSFGAAGDAKVLACSTTASSTTIAVGGGSFGVGDVGKSAVLFSVGTVTSGTNRQDFISTVASASGSNLVLNAAPTLSADLVRLILGTQNKTAFQNAINACASTDDTITIASGRYLFVPGTGPAITFSRGGIHFLGASATNTILLNCGAWQLVTGAAHRGELFWSQGPITNDYPLVFENLTFDGGVENGLTSNHFFPASATTGEGWDETHNAFKEAGGGLQQHSLKAFRNCTFAHWRGEVLIDNSAWTNSTNEATSCIFYDNNASAFNLAGTYQISGTVTTNDYISMEYYSGYANGNGFMTGSDFGENIVILGALSGHTQPAFLITSNVFRGYMQLSPAANLQILHNTFLNPTWGIETTYAGYQGTDHNHDILVASNLFNGVGGAVVLNGSGSSWSDRITVIGNTNYFSSASMVSGFGISSNVLLTGGNVDSIRPIVNSASFSGGQWALDDGSNLGTAKVDFQTVTVTDTNVTSFAYGVHHQLSSFSNRIWVLEDSTPGSIPAGATMTISLFNGTAPRVWASHANYPNCYSRQLPSSGSISFSWTGTSWQPTDRIDAASMTVGTLRGQ